VTPIFTDSPTFHVEAYYGETPEAERALLEFVRQAFGFFQDRQLVVPRYGDAVPMPDAPWRRTARRLDVMSR
jgi:hypothetical protein